MIEIVGLVGAILLGGCALPQTIYCIRHKTAKDVSALFLASWFVGEILMLAYIAIAKPDMLLIGNYVFNLACLVVIIYYKFRGVK